MSEIKGCIFDLDGVLVETSKFHYLAWSRLGSELGVSVTKEVNEQLKGVSRRRSLEVILSLGNLILDDPAKTELENKKNRWYLEYLKDMTREDTLPGVFPFLDELKAEGLKLAVGSSSRNARFILGKLELSDYFKTIVDGNDVKEAKPNPEIFLKAADELNVQPEQCIVFEDAISGVQAAKRGNFKCIGIGSPEILNEADLAVSSLKDMSLMKMLTYYTEPSLAK